MFDDDVYNYTLLCAFEQTGLSSAENIAARILILTREGRDERVVWDLLRSVEDTCVKGSLQFKTFGSWRSKTGGAAGASLPPVFSSSAYDLFPGGDRCLELGLLPAEVEETYACNHVECDEGPLEW